VKSEPAIANAIFKCLTVFRITVTYWNVYSTLASLTGEIWRQWLNSLQWAFTAQCCFLKTDNQIQMKPQFSHISKLTNSIQLSPSWKAASRSATHQFPNILQNPSLGYPRICQLLQNPNVHYRVHNSPSRVSTLSQTNVYNFEYLSISQELLTLPHQHGLRCSHPKM
jgi:hypothetical protein